jgi:uncharacterized Zn finger protein (UPF0148 family)
MGTEQKGQVIVIYYKGNVQVVCPVCRLNVLKVKVDTEEKEEK